MFSKDKRRADRRWRSRCKFIRRLKTDWNDHRWNWNYVTYPRSLTRLTPEASCSFWAGTTLCECFWNPKEMARFKDTPTGRHSNRKCGCSDPMTEYKDERRLEARDDWRKHERREGTRIVKLLCTRCGFLLQKVQVEFGKSPSWDHGSRLCEGCTEIMKHKNSYWLNGRPKEFEKKPA